MFDFFSSISKKTDIVDLNRILILYCILRCCYFLFRLLLKSQSAKKNRQSNALEKSSQELSCGCRSHCFYLYFPHAPFRERTVKAPRSPARRTFSAPPLPLSYTTANTANELPINSSLETKTEFVPPDLLSPFYPPLETMDQNVPFSNTVIPPGCCTAHQYPTSPRPLACDPYPAATHAIRSKKILVPRRRCKTVSTANRTLNQCYEQLSKLLLVGKRCLEQPLMLIWQADLD